VDADGNCFFRAACDQLDGPGGDHAALRAQLVAHMQLESDSYAPFVEDDESFDKYCERMARDGTWAGQMEVQALVRVRDVGVCIHQAGSPPWLIEAPDGKARGVYLHLTYEDGEHYNSVRCAKHSDAGGPGGPKPLPGVAPPPEDEHTTEAGAGADAGADAAEEEQAAEHLEPQAAPPLVAKPPAEPVVRPGKPSARERAEAKRAAKAAKAAARQRLAAGLSRVDTTADDAALAAPLAALRL